MKVGDRIRDWNGECGTVTGLDPVNTHAVQVQWDSDPKDIQVWVPKYGLEVIK